MGWNATREQSTLSTDIYPRFKEQMLVFDEVLYWTSPVSGGLVCNY